MTNLLLTIDCAASVSEQEVLLTPFFNLPEFIKPPKQEISVLLKLPDGAKQVLKAEIGGFGYDIPPGQPNCVCLLKGINKDDVIVGTEVWFYE